MREAHQEGQRLLRIQRARLIAVRHEEEADGGGDCLYTALVLPRFMSHIEQKGADRK